MPGDFFTKKTVDEIGVVEMGVDEMGEQGSSRSGMIPFDACLQHFY